MSCLQWISDCLFLKWLIRKRFNVFLCFGPQNASYSLVCWTRNYRRMMSDLFSLGMERSRNARCCGTRRGKAKDARSSPLSQSRRQSLLLRYTTFSIVFNYFKKSCWNELVGDCSGYSGILKLHAQSYAAPLRQNIYSVFDHFIIKFLEQFGSNWTNNRTSTNSFKGMIILSSKHYLAYKKPFYTIPQIITLCFPGPAPQSNNGGLLSATSSEIRRHAKRERAEEVPSDASEPMGAHNASHAGGVFSVGSSAFARDTTATASATAGSWAATAVVTGAGLTAITR